MMIGLVSSRPSTTALIAMCRAPAVNCLEESMFYDQAEKPMKAVAARRLPVIGATLLGNEQEQ